MSHKSKHTTDPELLEFLSQPEAYPDQPEKVEHIQTHISHVFMADPYVYKIKKPVDFEFLDYSTLEKRKEFCRREVELNRRLSDNIYLGVVPIMKNENSYYLESEQDGTVVEYAVKMMKLPEEYFLHTFIEEGSLTYEHLDRVSEKLAEFYLHQQPDQEILKWGQIEKIRYNTDENFRQTEPFIDSTIEQTTFDAIRRFTNRYFDEHEPLFQKRIDQECIIDGHGDLHLEHIHLIPDSVCIYDCIEFNDRFRYGDWAVDLAFLAMDLDFYGCWKESQYFVDRMAEKLSDEDLVKIIDFYKCYRAYVKGKVKSLQSGEEEVPAPQRQQSVEKAGRYFGLSLHYALLGSRPVVLIVMGRVGSGKTTLATQLSEKLDIEHFSSDRIRKQMAGLPLEERTPAARRESLYSFDQSKKTYNKLRESAEKQFSKGESAILDATFSDRKFRQNLDRKLRDKGVDFISIEAQASDEVIKKRLRMREENEGVISDARLEDFEALTGNYQAPDEREGNHLISVSTDQPFEATLNDLFKELIDRHLKKHNITT